MPQSQRTTTTPLEAIAVTGIAFGLFIIASVHAVANSFSNPPFSNASFLVLIAMEVVLCAAAIGFLYARGFAITTLLPVPNLKGSMVGFALFVIAWVLGGILVLPFSTVQLQQPVISMLTNAKVSLSIIIVAAIFNGAFEEVFLLGFLLRGLRGYGLSFALSATLLIRILYHMYQGPLGPIGVLAIGIVFGLYYSRSVQLWPPVFAHILLDIVPFILIKL